jgi:hypothetical protein
LLVSVVRRRHRAGSADDLLFVCGDKFGRELGARPCSLGAVPFREPAVEVRVKIEVLLVEVSRPPKASTGFVICAAPTRGGSSPSTILLARLATRVRSASIGGSDSIVVSIDRRCGAQSDVRLLVTFVNSGQSE